MAALPAASAAQAALRDVFGFAGFRPGQAEVVEAQLAGRDVLSVAPTGSGKSLSYWLPAVVGGGLTLVVSPLIALMKDQVDRLRSLGVPAGYVNSSLERELQVRQLEVAEAGGLRLLYVAPERFRVPGFLGRLERLRVRRLVVDEAHCISSWGHDFRPEYRELERAVAACGRPPIAAFTATATPPVRADIAASLGMREARIFVTGFHRPNLRLAAERCRGEAGKREALLRTLDFGSGRALVYTGTRAAAEQLAVILRSRGLAAAAYHAGLPDPQRRRVQEEFAAAALRVVVATTAFGMGVDLPDVRQVIHHHLPGSLEGYYQEAGRAGRDGLPADCVLLWSPADRELHSYFIEQTQPAPAPPVKAAAYARLGQMIAYARLRSCRHARIADYFGESGVARRCQACDNCLAPAPRPERAVAEPDLRAALAAAARFGGRFGAAKLATVLRGQPNAWTRRLAWLAETPHYGALPWPEERLRELLAEMVEAGLLSPGAGEYPVLEVTGLGRRALAGQAAVEVRLAEPAPAGRDQARSPARRSGLSADGAGDAGPGHSRPADPALLERLRRWRLEVARRESVPAYVVFHDRTLAEIAQRAPASRPALGAVPGVGPAKLERYGPELLALVQSCLK